MKIIRRDIQFYIQKMRLGEYFSLAGYSDAEWYCMLRHRIGTETALGQLLTEEQGDKLTDIIVRRNDDERFMFAVPDCIESLPAFRGSRLNRFLRNKLGWEGWREFVAYERDMVTDDLAEAAGLYPFISQLQKMNVVIIGNKHLRGLEFLKYKHFVEISTPNLHLEESGVWNTVENVLNRWRGNNRYHIPHRFDNVYLVSAGVSAAVIIDQLYDEIPNSWLIDCGSIWDAFVGIGGQREWRAKLYADPKRYQRWLNANLHGAEYEKSF